MKTRTANTCAGCATAAFLSMLEAAAAAMQMSIAAEGTQLAIIPWLYSIDQMPHSHTQTRTLLETLATAADSGSEMKLE